MKKIAVITGTRAEYGLLRPVIEKIQNDMQLELCLMATGMHLSPEFGMTYQEIERDGYPICYKNEMLLSSDTTTGTIKSVGLAIIGFAEAYEREKPDYIIILGDRFEAMAAATAAMIANIPIAHISGGERTEGAIDESIRHSISKMSSLHFTSTQEYRKRVIQLGEQPENVYDVGALGVENIKKLTLLDKEELEKKINFKMNGETIIVTFHPVTLESHSSKEQFQNILNAISYFQDLKVIFTKANADAEGRIINAMIEKYVMEHKQNTIFFDSMGQVNYFSAIKCCSMVLGNSSSGIIEVPSFKVPTINVGDRQKGRMQAQSVINCEAKTEKLIQAMKMAREEAFIKQLETVKNPYEGTDTSEKILNILKQCLENEISNKKEFYDIDFNFK